MTKRSPVAVVIFTLLSCGIYGIYYAYKAAEELESEAGPGKFSPIVILLLTIFAGFVGYILLGMTANDSLNKIRENKGIAPVDNTVLYIILALFIPIILLPIIQSEMNALSD